ncbi:MAG: aldehyde ferredoxin oxidoreductase C-terminal domain-containing protein, partial [Candidatus Moraniibacteriota bacterium]
QGVARYGERNSVAAMHVKGMELAAYPGNFNPGYAFAIAGPHMSMDTYNRAWYPQATNALEEWLENILRGPKILLYDMIGLCKFAKASFEDIATLYENATGEKVTPDQLKNSAQAIYFLARRIDVNQGFTAEDDALPERCFERWDSRVSDFLTRDFFENLKQMVYQSFEKMDV